MKKMRIGTLAKELGIDVNKLIKLKMDKLTQDQYKGFGKNTWLSMEGAETLRLAVEAPLAVPDKLFGTVLVPARNPRWVYAKLEGKEGRVPVAIPRKFKAEMLIGKRIPIDSITDASGGTTYRHEILATA